MGFVGTQVAMQCVSSSTWILQISKEKFLTVLKKQNDKKTKKTTAMRFFTSHSLSAPTPPPNIQPGELWMRREEQLRKQNTEEGFI